MDLCTFVYRGVFKKQEIFYSLQCGKLSVRVSPDPNILDILDQGLNFGANGVALEEGQFHCWIIGPWKGDQLLQPYEFIDFTSRFYKENSIKQSFEWNRNDIGDYIWIEGQDMCELTGISFDADQSVSEKAIQDWSKNPLQKKMFQNSLQTYQKLIQ